MSGKEFSYVKKELSEVLISAICPIGKKINILLDDKGYLDEVLQKWLERTPIQGSFLNDENDNELVDDFVINT